MAIYLFHKPPVPERVKVKGNPVNYAMDVFRKFQEKFRDNSMSDAEIMIGIAVYLSALKSHAPDRYEYILSTADELKDCLIFNGGNADAP